MVVISQKPSLTVQDLEREAIYFSKEISKQEFKALYGVNDGKNIGTFIEHKLKEYLREKYQFDEGNSASGIDLPSIETDIKVTSIIQPQSSCPFKSARQKIFGLGYNLSVFVYEKEDNLINKTSKLKIKNFTFILKHRTGDYNLTRSLISLKQNGAIKEDIIGQFYNVNLPGDEITYEQLADEVLREDIFQGYLTISNALQWRLQYQRVIDLNNKVNGVHNYTWI